VDFRLRCDCGNEVVVTEGSAGADVRCDCGRLISVPGLKELRQQAGLPAYDPSPELVIEQMLASGEPPAEKTCVHCGVTTDRLEQIVIECERSWKRRADGSGWLTGCLLLPLSTFLFVVWMIWRLTKRPEEVELLGRDKIYTLPLSLCPLCAPQLKNASSIKEHLRKVPIYRRLLDKFPDARVSIASK